MSADVDTEPEVLKNASEILDGFFKELIDLYAFRDLFFENHPLDLATEKNRYVEERKTKLLEKFESIDEMQIPFHMRAQFLHYKGRCYNISSVHDPRATQSLSKAVKLNPHLVDAWNELGDSYWKNANIREAKASFEGALKHERSCIALRCLSIILRQEGSKKKDADHKSACSRSVELAKEAVSKNLKDGVSWMVLGNAYLCQYFTVTQDPYILKLCMSAYKQAWTDPIARGHPDLYYNKGIALKYQESYNEALENFEYACSLDPPWSPPKTELVKLQQYLAATDKLVRTKGMIKPKKLAQMVQSMDKSLDAFAAGTLNPKGKRREVALKLSLLDALQVGSNPGKVIIGRVVGSIHSETAVPFTFALVDESMVCVCVTVYNWAAGKGAIIGDCVSIPEPTLYTQKHESKLAKYDFKSIRVDNPTMLMVNGRRVGFEQFGCTKVTSTYEIH